MRMQAAWGLVLAGILAGCGGSSSASGEVDELRAEVRALRRQLEAARTEEANAEQRRGALRKALGPLREAVEAIVSRHEQERARWESLTTDVGRLAQIVQQAVREEERAALAAVRARVHRLETGLAEDRERQTRDQELTLDAIEATVERLDEVLRATTPATPAVPPVPGPEDAARPVRKSAIDLIVLLGIASTVLAVVVVVLLTGGRRPRPGAPVRIDLGEHAAEAPRVEDPPEGGARREGPRGPRRIVLPLRDEELGETLSGWLAQEPDVLVEPAPRVRRENGHVLLECHVAGTMADPDVERLLARARLQARAASSPAGRGSS